MKKDQTVAEKETLKLNFQSRDNEKISYGMKKFILKWQPPAPHIIQ